MTGAILGRSIKVAMTDLKRTRTDNEEECMPWIDACAKSDIEEEDLIRFDHE